ncbi:MAG: glycoside hydrolase family 36 protein [Chloroflexota bacterium]
MKVLDAGRTEGRLQIELIQLDEQLSLARGSGVAWQTHPPANLAVRSLYTSMKSPNGLEMEATPQAASTSLGSAQRWSFSCPSGDDALSQTLVVDAYPAWPDAFVLYWQFENRGTGPVQCARLDCPTLVLGDWTSTDQPGVRPWTLQGAAVKWGQDFAFQLPEHFERQNFLGHIDNGEGGGIPLLYCWTARRGLALAHIEPQPKDWYMPVCASEGDGIEFSLQYRQAVHLQPGETLHSLRVLVSLHQGDFFAPLSLYRKLLARQGVAAPEPVPADFEPGWCSWGYEFDVRPEEMTGVLPALKELGIRWLTLDDRWFDAYGDWNPRPETFPDGAAHMRRMNAEIHNAGAYSQIWWYPLSAEDGNGDWESHPYGKSRLLEEHPDWVILNADGSVARNNRHLAMLCPALPEVRQHVAELTRRFIEDWGFDGHKLDNIYTIPACHNPAHHHARPEESTEAMADAYRLIFEITRQLRLNSVTQICPCGTPVTLHLLPYTNQTVTADPTSSAQIRQRIKFYKALSGPRTAVFADHVELSDGGVDFASEIGAGGVPATKFIYPDDPAVATRLKEVWNLPPEKRTLWKKWFDIYAAHRLAEGEYLNLYDLAYDQPEAHAIRKNGRIYYAFFASAFRGALDLRGLEPRTYRVVDYVDHRTLCLVNGPTAALEAAFESAFLIYLEPV